MFVQFVDTIYVTVLNDFLIKGIYQLTLSVCSFEIDLEPYKWLETYSAMHQQISFYLSCWTQVSDIVPHIIQ